MLIVSGGASASTETCHRGLVVRLRDLRIKHSSAILFGSPFVSDRARRAHAAARALPATHSFFWMHDPAARASLPLPKPSFQPRSISLSCYRFVATEPLRRGPKQAGR